jgi:hypothetical protein
VLKFKCKTPVPNLYSGAFILFFNVFVRVCMCGFFIVCILECVADLVIYILYFD